MTYDYKDGSPTRVFRVELINIPTTITAGSMQNIGVQFPVYDAREISFAINYVKVTDNITALTAQALFAFSKGSAVTFVEQKLDGDGETYSNRLISPKLVAAGGQAIFSVFPAGMPWVQLQMNFTAATSPQILLATANRLL